MSKGEMIRLNKRLVSRLPENRKKADASLNVRSATEIKRRRAERDSFTQRVQKSILNVNR